MRNSGRRLSLLLLVVVPLFFNSLSPAFAAWTAPAKLNTSDYRRYTQDPSFFSLSSLAVQQDGVAHLVYLQKKGKIYYIIDASNETGAWQKRTVTSSLTKLGMPSAAVYNHELYLVWARGSRTRSEILYAHNGGGVWSTSRITADTIPDISPTIIVHRGKVYISWIKARHLQANGSVRLGSVYIKTNASGHWRSQQIGNTHYWPSAPVMQVDGRGAVHVVYDAALRPGAPSILIHAYTEGGSWRKETVPTNLDGASPASLDAQLPSLALYKNRVYVAFMSAPKNRYMSPANSRIALAVKSAGSWRLKALTNESYTSISVAPRVAVSKGRVRVAFTKIAESWKGTITSTLRYLELANGRLRGETLESASSSIGGYGETPPPTTIFMVTGFDCLQDVAHISYLRLDAGQKTLSAEFNYRQREGG